MTVCKRGHIFSIGNRTKSGRCRECQLYRMRKYRQSEKGKRIQAQYYQVHKDRLRRYSRTLALKLSYGITQEQYTEFSKKQNDKCAICNKIEKLSVDHDHHTGEIRGLLCFHCNTGLGHFYDNPIKLQAAIQYLGEKTYVNS